MRNKLYRPKGLSLISAPVTSSDRANNRARGIKDLGCITGAQLLRALGHAGNGPLLFCGSQSSAFPLIRQAALSSEKPFLLVGMERSLRDSCFLSLGPDWTHANAKISPPPGSGCFMLSPGQEAHLELKESLPGWGDYYVILLPGNGLQLDGNDLDLLNALGSYALVTDQITRCFAVSNETGLPLSRVFESMELIIYKNPDAGVRELVTVLPTIQMVNAVNAMDYSSYRNGLGVAYGTPMRGRGLRLSQSRSVENKPVLEEDQILKALRRGRSVIIEMAKRSVWIADYH